MDSREALDILRRTIASLRSESAAIREPMLRDEVNAAAEAVCDVADAWSDVLAAARAEGIETAIRWLREGVLEHDRAAAEARVAGTRDGAMQALVDLERSCSFLDAVRLIRWRRAGGVNPHVADGEALPKES